MSATQQGNGKKLVFVGDSGVGKTCIITRFLKGTFNSNELTTDGASYASKTIEIPEMKEFITFDIWDTAGQERYKSLTKFFFQGAKMAILVYDITVRQSYDSMKNEWYKQLKDYGDSDVIIGIAGNKSDLYEDEEAVSEQEARDFAKSIGAIFSLTSAQSNTGINELFKDLGRKYLDPNFNPNLPNPSPSPNSNPNPNPNPQPNPRKDDDKKDNIVIGKAKKDGKKPNKFC